MNTESTHLTESLKHLHPGGADGFNRLPCVYGDLRVPESPRLRGIALCHVALPPHGVTRDEPQETGHYHRRTTELYCFTGGSGRMLLNGAWREVREGTVALVPPLVMHTAQAGEGGLSFIVWTCPAFNPTDMFGLEDYPREFQNHDPAWIRQTPNRSTASEVNVTSLHQAADWELAVALLAPGAHIPEHLHARAEEAYFIMSGEAVVTLDGARQTAGRGTMVSLPPGARHGISAGPQGVCYFVMATPPIPVGDCVVPRTG